jgi:hypothetical protein
MMALLACAACLRSQAPVGALRRLAPSGTKIVVLYFVASDCPISNRTLPEMLRIEREFAPRGVAFRFIYPNTSETPQTLREHQAAFAAGSTALLDPDGTLVALAHARVTPQAAVLVRDGANWRPIYTGRIDNRYLRLGVERPQATEHYAEQAVLDVLAGQPVPPDTGTPVGCAIVNPQAPAQESEGR